MIKKFCMIKNMLFLVLIGLVFLDQPLLAMKRKNPFGDGPRKRKRGRYASKYDTHLDDDDVYYCPDCDYSGKSLTNFRNHVISMGHAGYKRKKCKYDKYLDDNAFVPLETHKLLLERPRKMEFRDNLLEWLKNKSRFC